MKKRILITSLLLIHFSSCDQRSPGIFKVIVTDTTITHNKHNELDRGQSYSRLLNLPNISNGVDSFEMRIWYWGLVEGNLLVNLRFAKENWIASKTECFFTGYGFDKKLDSANTKAIPVPKNTSSLVAYFTSDSILDLPSQQAIPGFVDNIGDGQSCFIEISTKSFYKALDYHCPENFSDKYNRKFLEAVMLLNRDFSFYLPWCKPSY